MIHFKIYDFKVTKCFEHIFKYNMIFSYQEMFMLRLGKKILIITFHINKVDSWKYVFSYQERFVGSWKFFDIH